MIASLTEHLGIPRAGSGPCKGRPDAFQLFLDVKYIQVSYRKFNSLKIKIEKLVNGSD
jgi:hypothetical protein